MFHTFRYPYTWSNIDKFSFFNDGTLKTSETSVKSYEKTPPNKNFLQLLYCFNICM